MRKRIMALCMIFACLFSMMPTTQAITLVEVAEQAKLLVPGITSIDDVEVPTDVLLKRTASSTYDAVGPISFTSDAVTVSEKFDYVTEIDMVNVKQAMVDLKTLVLTIVDDADKPSIEQEINDSTVTGEFEIKVKYPASNYVVNPLVLSANNMAGFTATKNNLDVSADVFENIFQEVSRTNDTTNNEITLKVKVRDDIGHEVTYAKLIADLCDKLSFECLENTITGYGTYTVEVSVTGKTIIHSNSSEIGDIEYNFVQIPENADPVNPSKTSATVKINRANNAGGVTKNTVTIVYGGDLADKKTSYNRGTLVETDNFVIPEREGFEFVGLYKDEALTQPADDEFIITTDVILYAKWRNVTGEKCTVTIVGGVEDLQYVCGKDEVVNKADLPVPEKPGYLLEGLFMDPEYTIPVDETLTVSTDMILYAKLVLVPLELEHPLITGYHFAYIIGDEDSEGRPQVRPEDNITRQEVATVFYRLLKDEVRIALETTENPFSDVTEADWSNLAVSTMANGGYIEGYEGTDLFMPKQDITRAEFATIVARLCDMSEEDVLGIGDFYDTENHWASSYIKFAARNGLVEGYDDGLYYPDQKITRAEVMKIVNYLLNRRVNEEGLLPETERWRDNPSDKWYYYEVIEATNTHDFVREEGAEFETWTQLLPNPAHVN